LAYEADTKNAPAEVIRITSCSSRAAPVPSSQRTSSGINIGTSAGIGALIGLIEEFTLEMLRQRAADGTIVAYHPWYDEVSWGFCILKVVVTVVGIGALVAGFILTGGTISIVLVILDGIAGWLASLLGNVLGHWLARALKSYFKIYPSGRDSSPSSSRSRLLAGAGAEPAEAAGAACSAWSTWTSNPR
jgi:hypothetical protein